MITIRYTIKNPKIRNTDSYFGYNLIASPIILCIIKTNIDTDIERKVLSNVFLFISILSIIALKMRGWLFKIKNPTKAKKIENKIRCFINKNAINIIIMLISLPKASELN